MNIVERLFHITPKVHVRKDVWNRFDVAIRFLVGLSASSAVYFREPQVLLQKKSFLVCPTYSAMHVPTLFVLLWTITMNEQRIIRLNDFIVTAISELLKIFVTCSRWRIRTVHLYILLTLSVFCVNNKDNYGCEQSFGKSAENLLLTTTKTKVNFSIYTYQGSLS